MDLSVFIHKLPQFLGRVRLWHAAAWGVRLLIVVVLLRQITPAGVRAPLDTPQTVQTAAPHVCTHTRLIDEVSEARIQQSLRAVREMGATHIVEFFPWAYIEYAPGAYDWTQTDLILKHAENQGVQIIARMGLVPEWARPDPEAQPTTFNFLPYDQFDAFARFAAVFAARYAGRIDQLIIWNEPNLAFEWGYRPVDPAAYVELLRAVYARAHAANPNVLVLAGALAPTLEPAGSGSGLNDILYLEAMYEAGAAPYFDALAVHTYGLGQPPAADPDPQQLNYRRVELLREVMVTYGDEDKQVVITETGWNDHPRWTYSVRPSQRAAYTVEALAYAAENWPWAAQVCLWALRYPRDTYSYPDNYTLITPDFQIKPIYYAVQAYARGWETDEALWLPPPTEP